jgi:hypothetical protein
MTVSTFIVSTASGHFLLVSKTNAYVVTTDRAKATIFASELAAEAAKMEWALRLHTAAVKAHARVIKAAKGRTIAPLTGSIENTASNFTVECA